MPPVVVFSTTSDIEASVVLALLDSQGISGFRITGNPQAILPMSMSPLGEVRIAVPEDLADDARRIIDSHREDVGARVVRLRDEFDGIETRIEYRFKDRGLLEHALTHKSRAAEDVSGGVADNESLEFLGGLQRRAEVEDQGLGRLDAGTGAPGREHPARRAPDSRAGRREDGRPFQAGAAGGRVRSAHRGDLPRWRPRRGGRVPAPRAEGCDRRRRRARLRRPGLQVSAAGTGAGTRPFAPRVPHRRRGGPGSPEGLQHRGCRGRGSAWYRQRESEERSRAGSGPACARKALVIENQSISMIPQLFLSSGVASTPA